ncbi:MAG: NAD(P)H-hydrate dehydratase [Clostridia bacterium]
MKNIVTGEKMRALDAYMINECKIPAILLMESAAEAVLNEITEGGFKRVLILCGAGNNGGDGLALLRKLIMRGIDAEGALLFADETFSGEARLNLDILKSTGVIFKILDSKVAVDLLFSGAEYDIIIDAIFGTGLNRNIEGNAAYVIERANAFTAFKIAVDIPSGVDATTGHIFKTAFRADKTVTFQAIKRGLLIFPGREFAGDVILKKIGLTPENYKISNEFLIEQDDVRMLLPIKRQNSNKGDFGRLLIIAGSENMRGAPIMTLRAAIRGGAGLTKLLSVASVVENISLKVPEAMAESLGENYDAIDFDVLKRGINFADCIAIGPGMGGREGVFKIVSEVLMSKKPTVIDADALNALSLNSGGLSLLHENAVVTPHLKEFSRLSLKSVDEIIDDPVNSALCFSKRFSAAVLLKGPTTIITNKDGELQYNITGNAGLAKGGSGDVLTGLIGAMLASKLNPFSAAGAGAFLLGHSAMTAARLLNLRALIASDVIDAIGETL